MFYAAYGLLWGGTSFRNSDKCGLMREKCGSKRLALTGLITGVHQYRRRCFLAAVVKSCSLCRWMKVVMARARLQLRTGHPLAAFAAVTVIGVALRGLLKGCITSGIYYEALQKPTCRSLASSDQLPGIRPVAISRARHCRI